MPCARDLYTGTAARWTSLPSHRSVHAKPATSRFLTKERATGVEPATEELGKLSGPSWGKGFSVAVAETG